MHETDDADAGFACRLPQGTTLRTSKIHWDCKYGLVYSVMV